MTAGFWWSDELWWRFALGRILAWAAWEKRRQSRRTPKVLGGAVVARVARRVELLVLAAAGAGDYLPDAVAPLVHFALGLERFHRADAAGSGRAAK
jgi:hypothetical protein